MTQRRSLVLSGRIDDLLARSRPLGAGLLAAGLLTLGPMGCSIGTPFEATAESNLIAPVNATQLTIENTVGDITVISDAAATGVSAVVIKKGRGSTQQRADEALTEIRLSLAEVAGTPGTVLAKAEHPKSSNKKNYSVEWRITAPTNAKLVVGVDVGDVTIRDFASGAKITTDVGDVDAQNIAGGLEVKTDVGDITAKNITGNLTAQTDVGDINARAAGQINCRTNVGDLTLNVFGEPGQPIVALTDVGDLDVRLPAGLSGSLSAAVDTGDLSVRLGDTPMKNVEQKRKRFMADFAAPGPKLKFETDVGDLTLRLAEPGV